ncbi:hypothetical protein [Candidatus Palauibacter sp.]|uniref:hypothetical protein n=1 Tax=Candidatus Palauibacter sp. TaxID=3101350 RepID=UPI003B5B185B
MLSLSKLRVRSVRLATAGWLVSASVLGLPLAAAAQEDKLPPPESLNLHFSSLEVSRTEVSNG